MKGIKPKKFLIGLGIAIEIVWTRVGGKVQYGSIMIT